MVVMRYHLVYTNWGRRCYAVLPHNWLELPDRGPFEKAFVGNTSFLPT